MNVRQLALFTGVIHMLIAAAVSDAAPPPNTVPLTAPSAAESVIPENAFVCGTYQSSLNEVRWMHALYRDRLRRTQAASPPNHSVYEDVWVVEDDGSLLISGLNAFDMDGTTIRFTPNGGGGFDVAVVAQAYDPVVGTNLGLGDDSNATVGLAFSFPYYGVGWGSVHVNANGIVAFGADINPTGFYSHEDFFAPTPKIAPYFMDLNPAGGGGVYHKGEATQSTITWRTVPEYGTANHNTVQLVLRDDGSFDLTFDGIASTLQANGLPIHVGAHPGGASAPLELIRYSNDLPYAGSSGAGIYESFMNFTDPLVNEVSVFQLFYQNFPDDFFQLAFFTTFTQTMSGFANERNIRNDIQGIGLGVFDGSALYGSAGVLESRCNMARIAVWPTDPTARNFGGQNNFLTIMGQESAHRWGAFVNFEDSTMMASELMLGRANAHWNYYADVDHSCLEGGDWELFLPGDPDQFIVPTKIDFFCDIDQYLFGLRTPEEVSPSFYVSSPTNDLPENRSQTPPIQGATAEGTAIEVTIDDIIAAEGPRVPSERPNKDLRQGFIIIHKTGNPPSQAALDKVVAFREAWEPYFEQACDGRITCNTSLTQTFPVGVIEGHVKDIVTKQPLDEIVVESLERGFTQFVPGGGRYTFRYMADAVSGPSEGITIAAEASGYLPDTLVIDLPYDTAVTYDLELVPIVTAAGGRTSLPAVSRLEPAYPNPFNPSTTIRFDVGSAGRVVVAVFDATGRHVRTLLDRVQVRGEHVITWDGRDAGGQEVASGVYFLRLTARDAAQTRKVVLVR